MKKPFTTLAVALLLSLSSPLHAEDFHIEFTAGAWLLSPSGNIQTSVTRVDLRDDLGIADRKTHPAFKVVAKPRQKHRIVFEAIPYRFDGTSVVSRTFVLGGRTYAVQDRITSEAKIDYIFGGYQYDFVNNDRGHFGVGAGAAYFGAKASVTSDTLGTTGTEDRKAGIPLAGGEFRVFPIPSSQVFNINGEAKGMSLGSYGWYFQMAANAGVAPTRFLRLQAGFHFAEGDLHQVNRLQGFNLRFAGPIFSLQLHD